MAQKLPFIIQSGVRTRGEPRVTGLTAMLCAAARYDFAEHGGAVGTINLGVTIPAGVLLFQRLVHVTTGLLPGTESGSVRGFTLDDADTDILTEHQDGNYDFTGNIIGPSNLPNNAFRITEDREIKFVISGEPVTEGVVDLYVYFLMPTE